MNVGLLFSFIVAGIVGTAIALVLADAVKHWND